MMKQAYSQHEFVALCRLVAKTDKVQFNEVQWDFGKRQLLEDITRLQREPIATPAVRRQLNKVLDRGNNREKAEQVRKTLQGIKNRL
jgi:hypothetical protein